METGIPFLEACPKKHTRVSFVKKISKHFLLTTPRKFENIKTIHQVKSHNLGST